MARGRVAHERSVEDAFYRDYQAYRLAVFEALGGGASQSAGAGKELVVRVQRFLDRCIFMLFCEGAGGLRGVLGERGAGEAWDPEGTDIAVDIGRLFVGMRERFGGLFVEEPERGGLALPNRLLCGRASITLLDLASRYEFGVRAAGERGIGLNMLGRIFERSIPDLERLVARAEGRASLAEPSRRKQEGVYYTPEWVAVFVVEQTLGPRLAALRAAAGLHEGAGPQELGALAGYERALRELKVVDPACGSGVLLIQALRYLVRVRAWVALARARASGVDEPVDLVALARDVVTRNIRGVDASAESVALAKLALWLETSAPDRPMVDLEAAIRCGNSLVEPGSWGAHVEAFDWAAAFPEVFETRAGPRRGFDCVVGNPPYVKLQNLRRVDPGLAEYLVHARRAGQPQYRSTQTGSFDLYLPFIEKGLALLAEDGVMGYIAPGAWTMNEHGAGLRGLVRGARCLDRWVDLGDLQVFAEAITYTSLQFFRGRAVDEICHVQARGGALAEVDWGAATRIRHAELPEVGRWLFLPAAESRLLRRLAQEHVALGQMAAIVVGLQTSADHVYHLRRVGADRYRSGVDGEVVAIEDAVMRPLVSGPEARRYASPTTSTYLLFPYDDTDGAVRLYAPDELRRQFPFAWAHLVRHEGELRGRERGAFDDEGWYRFGRQQNLDKQRLRKLGVAQTVPSMRVFYDPAGAYCFNNVRVNGILVDDEETGWFLLGVLNGAVADFVFRRGAKRKAGGYFEANKQFIAPLPVPRATADQRAGIAAQARRLQALHDERLAIGEVGDRIAEAEAAMNAALARLYGLSDQERALVAGSGP